MAVLMIAWYVGATAPSMIFVRSGSTSHLLRRNTVIELCNSLLLFSLGISYARDATTLNLRASALEQALDANPHSTCEDTSDGDPEGLAKLLPPRVAHIYLNRLISFTGFGGGLAFSIGDFINRSAEIFASCQAEQWLGPEVSRSSWVARARAPPHSQARAPPP